MLPEFISSLTHLAVIGRGLDGLRTRQAAVELGLTVSLLDAALDASTLAGQARALGAEALHPGEAGAARQSDLAAACRRRGLRFIGLAPALLDAMVEGPTMRQRMREAGLPLVVDKGEGRALSLTVLADHRGRVVHLATRYPAGAAQQAPACWLTPEQRVYLGRLAVQGVTSLEAAGLFTLMFRVAGNRVGFAAMAPGPSGEEALDEALIGLDPLREQLRLALGGRLRERQAGLEAQGHARLWRLVLPEVAGFSGGPGLRLDRAAGDPGARLLAWGRRPEEAHARGQRALIELLGEKAAAAWLMADPGDC